jgi:hypothetical protein
MAPEYAFLTSWRLKASAQDVYDVLSDPLALKRWWPSVYLDVKELKPATGPDGVGRVIDLYTKGWLPYTLDWDFRVTASQHPHGFSLEAEGDLAGVGDWRFEQDGAWTVITYDWRVRAEKPLLRILSPLLRPLLEYNHRWAMARGEESLRLELYRRRCATPSERARIPAPPPPTAVSAAPLIASGLAAGAAAFLVARALRGGRRRRLSGAWKLRRR